MPVDPLLRSPLTVQKVSSLVRKSGLPITKSHTTAVKGWHGRTSGFQVYKPIDGSDCIHVIWRESTMGTRDKVYNQKQYTKLLDHLRAEGMRADMIVVDEHKEYVEVRYAT